MPIAAIYEPELVCAGVLLAPIESVRASVQSQLKVTIGEHSFCSKLERIDWRGFFERDGLFYNGKRFQIALFQVEKGCTVYVCNLADGWVSLYENLIKSNSLDAYFFRATISESAEYKVFEMIGWRDGVLERRLRVLQDDTRWEFLNQGDPLPFEDVVRYKERRISARADSELIDRYSEAVGYRISSVTRFHDQCWRFWRSK